MPAPDPTPTATFDEAPSQRTPARGRARRLAVFSGAGVIAYLLALAATVPAATALRWGGVEGVAASGTMWDGQVALAGGHALAWEHAPLRSVEALALAADVRLDGPDTVLAGQATARPGRLTLTRFRGPASAATLSALLPALPFVCDAAMGVEIDRATIGEDAHAATGRLRTEAGSCRPRAGGASTTALPTLIAVARPEGAATAIRLTTATVPTERLAEATLTPAGALTVATRPALARLLPGLTPGLVVETRL